MAKTFNLSQAQYSSGMQREWLYNALDCIATLEIDNVLDAQMTDADRRTMNMYLASQAMAAEMTYKGIRVSESDREALQAQVTKEIQEVRRKLAKHPLIAPIWDKLEKNSGACHRPTRKDGKHKWPRGVEDTPEKKCEDCGASRFKVRPFMPSSDDDLKHLFYDLWKLKKQTDKDGKVTTGKEARERLRERYKKYAEPIALIDEFAGLNKQLGFLKFRTDDGRFHAGFNVGVTDTHRWSSNKDQFGRGGNAQNITEKHRHIFTADPGKVLVYADLKQAESNIIAHVAGDPEYINAHLTGDTHTYVCRLVWPEGINGQEWTWNDINADKKIATSAAPPWDDRPGHDYRFQSKAVQHGSNLGLTPFGLAIQKRIPVSAARDAQGRYFKAFPGIRDYQSMVRSAVEAQEPLITPLGVRFKLFGRPWDEGTYKQGLSKIPQATVGHIISIGLWRIAKQLPEVDILAQIHDAILVQVDEDRMDLVYDIMELMRVPVEVRGVDGTVRTVVIETEAAVGKNWGHANTNPDKGRLNPDGVREITFQDKSTWSLK